MVKINLNQISSEKVYLKLNQKCIEFILNLIKKSNLILNKEFKEQLYRFKRGNKVSTNFIKKISILLDLDNHFFEKNIKLITSCKNTRIGIKNPRFPIDFSSEEGVRLISAIMGDGEINKQLQVRYNNQSKKLILIVLGCFKKVFGDINYKIYLRKDKTYQLHFPKITGIIILNLGLKEGYKSLTNYGVPNFIHSLKNNKKAIFIKQFFDDEGNVRLKDRRLQIKQTLKIYSNKKELRSNPEKYAHKTLIGIKKLLQDIGIDSKIYLGNYRVNEKKADWELSIYCKENLEKFQKHVGFELDYKNQLLNQCIKSYKFPSAPRNGRITFALINFKKVQNKKRYVTKYFLAKESDRSLKTATYFLIDLKKKGIIKEIKRSRNKKGHPQARKYVLV